MRSRLLLFKLEIQQARYFYSPAILLYWHMLTCSLIFKLLHESANKPLAEMLNAGDKGCRENTGIDRVSYNIVTQACE